MSKVEPTDWETIEREERPQAKRIAEYFGVLLNLDVTRSAVAWIAAAGKPTGAPYAVEALARWGSLFGTSKILDVGCGPGLYVEEMRAVGLDAYGVDNDERLVENEWLRKVEITKPFLFGHGWPIVFDIVLSLEVGEHIPEEGAESYVKFIRKSDAGVVFFSAARPGQGGHGHINCQPKNYWVRLFHQAGFYVDHEATEGWLDFMRSGYRMGWLVQNGIVFRRG